MPRLSEYFYSLSQENQLRYLEKLIPLGGVDPYTLSNKDFSQEKNYTSKITYDKITQYLMCQISPFTQEEIRASKSMDAWVKVVCKWIKSIHFARFESYTLVVGKVCIIILLSPFTLNV